MDCANTIGRVNLLDLDDTFLPLCASSPVRKNQAAKISNPYLGTAPIDISAGFQGPVKRKCILKNGHKPTIAPWQRYWMQVWKNSVIFYTPRAFKNFDFDSSRDDFKREPSKALCLSGWDISTEYGVDGLKFENCGTASKYIFRTGSHAAARQWVLELNNCKVYDSEVFPANLMSFD